MFICDRPNMWHPFCITTFFCTNMGYALHLFGELETVKWEWLGEVCPGTLVDPWWRHLVIVWACCPVILCALMLKGSPFWRSLDFWLCYVMLSWFTTPLEGRAEALCQTIRFPVDSYLLKVAFPKLVNNIWWTKYLRMIHWCLALSMLSSFCSL